MKKNPILFPLQKSDGMTLVEALVGIALIAIFASMTISGLTQIMNQTTNTLVMSDSEKQIDDIAGNIRAGLASYQINFKMNADPGAILNVDDLPMAWDIGRILPRAQCPDCAGTYGYTIQPFEEYRGLYRVTLRMTHKNWIARGENFRDYTFVVSPK